MIPGPCKKGLLISGAFLLSCSGSQLAEETRTLKKSDSTTIEDTSKDSSLKIESGSAKGTDVTIPAGAIQIGSTVAVAKADTPGTFTDSGFTANNSPVAITATDASGNALEETIQPMTIQLPIAASTALLEVEKTDDNLCVLLETSSGVLFIWRRSAMEIADSKAKIQSKRLGIYMLVYCGQESATTGDFADAAQGDIAGEASKAMATIAIPAAGGDYSFSYGHTHICAGAMTLGGSADTNGIDKIWGLNDYKHTPGEALDVKILKTAGVDITTLEDGTSVEVFLYFQTATEKCESSWLKKTDNDGKFGVAIYRFTRTGAELKAGTMSGSLGDTAASWGLSKATVKMGRSDGGSNAAAGAVDACMGASTSGASGGHVKIGTAFTTDNKIGGNSDFTMYFPTSSSGTSKIYATVNSKKCLPADAHAQTDSASTQIATSFFRSVSAGATLYLTPVDITVDVSDPTSLAKKVCVRVYKSGDSVAIASATEATKTGAATVSFLAAVGSSTTYKVYVPFDATTVDLGYKLLTGSGDTCATAANGLYPEVPKTGVTLGSSVSVP